MSDRINIHTKYLGENITKLDELYDNKRLSLGEYMEIALLIKILEELHQMNYKAKLDIGN